MKYNYQFIGERKTHQMTPQGHRWKTDSIGQVNISLKNKRY